MCAGAAPADPPTPLIIAVLFSAEPETAWDLYWAHIPGAATALGSWLVTEPGRPPCPDLRAKVCSPSLSVPSKTGGFRNPP